MEQFTSDLKEILKHLPLIIIWLTYLSYKKLSLVVIKIKETSREVKL